MSKLPIVTTRADLRARLDEARSAGRRVAFVPTMGALHAGHLALVGEARRRADGAQPGLVVVSIFVNPTQFGPHEDFARYPRDLAGDADKCASAGADLVFAPTVEEMYPPGEQTRVGVGALAAPLCGEHRPGHFEGVATVVTKLFALVGPCVAVFGRKDYQQLRVVQQLARDLFLPVEVAGLATVRDPDGLAMSSRNAYLSPADRARALALPRALAGAAARFASGERDAEALAGPVRDAVAAAFDRVDYVSLSDADTLAPVAGRAGDRALLAVAARVGATRLIDNLVLGEDPAPAVG
jgi:pantoate--beta-alanine ligase